MNSLLSGMVYDLYLFQFAKLCVMSDYIFESNAPVWIHEYQLFLIIHAGEEFQVAYPLHILLEVHFRQPKHLQSDSIY